MSAEYPQGEPFETEMFEVSPLHKLYVELSGNPGGQSLIALHGGPGSKSKSEHRSLYNPEKYKIVLYDQRGSGKSTPLGETRENTTWDLVEDIEKIRQKYNLGKMVVSGGSWGSTLALAYAEKYPENVKALILRAIFTNRKWEREWLTKWGANLFFPEGWEKYENYIPKNERHDMTKAYAKRILAGDKKAAMISVNWENGLLRLIPEPSKGDEEFTPEDLAGAKVFYHYEENESFLKEGQLLENAHKLKGIPGVIIHGRYDIDCPPKTAWDLHKAWPGSILEIVIAGHLGSEPKIKQKILEYADKFAEG